MNLVVLQESEETEDYDLESMGPLLPTLYVCR